MPKVIEKLIKDPLMPLRHSTEHVLQLVMESKYPGLKKVMGPPIQDGFYGDFDFNGKISKEDLSMIEDEMKKVIEADLPFKMRSVLVEEAKEIFANNQFKLEFIDELSEDEEKVSICELGEKGDKYHDIDLCMGHHVKSTGKIIAFKLLSVAGAYWRSDENNEMLTRIYGTAFKSKKDLDKYLYNLEEAKKRDHRKLGKELHLFTFADEVGPGLPLYTPKGTIIREELEKWAKEVEEEWGYVRVATPHIAKHTLYEISGHLPYYKDDMYSPMDVDGEDYYLKGMNCPHHHMIYKSKPRSYRELPLRFAEYGTVYRYEQSGSLFGLMRTRSIAQNDGHIYCTMEQAETEFLEVIRLHEHYYQVLGLTNKDYYIEMGLPDKSKKDKYHGDTKTWQKAEEIMRNSIAKTNIETIDNIGGAAFYGPKIDFTIRSSIGREFSLSTNQLDLYMPQRFNLDYTDKDGTKKLAALIHRAPLGSHERFIGFLIEHFGGAFPVWLSPVQAVVIPIGEGHIAYSENVVAKMKKGGLRAELDFRSETMQAKIRDSQLQKIPYMLIVGDKEMKNDSVNVRLRTKDNKGEVKMDNLVEKIKDIYLTKGLKLW